MDIIDSKRKQWGDIIQKLKKELKAAITNKRKKVSKQYSLKVLFACLG